MSSQHCRSCFSPAYQVLSNRLHAYVCLNYDDCPDFLAIVSETETIRVAYPPAPGHPSLESHYPLWPLEANHHPYAANQTLITQPCPEQSTQQGSVAVPADQGPTPQADHPESSNDPTLLEQPLSELINAEGSEQMAEAIKFADRSVDQRRLEAEAAGKVKRHANSYILYRIAFQGVGCSPKIVGRSWAMESHQVKQAFAKLADRDRLLHEQAFPEYKFHPKPRRQFKLTTRRPRPKSWN